MTEVAFENFEFVLALSPLEGAVLGVDTSTADVAEIACNSDGMKGYRARVDTISELLSRYRTLLEKDTDSFRKVQDAVETLDAELASGFSR